MFTQSELFWLDDILPGAKNKHSVKMPEKENKTEHNLSSNEQIYKNTKDFNASKSVLLKIFI